VKSVDVKSTPLTSAVAPSVTSFIAFLHALLLLLRPEEMQKLDEMLVFEESL
jgi:hypothetical protein